MRLNARCRFKHMLEGICSGRAARLCFQRLVTFDRRACVEQHALAAESLVQAGTPYDLEDTRI